MHFRPHKNIHKKETKTEKGREKRKQGRQRNCYIGSEAVHQIAWIQVKNVQKCSREGLTQNWVNRMTGVSYFCPYLRFYFIRNVPAISTTFYRYFIISHILMSAPLHNTSRPNPARPDPVRRDPTRPDPSALITGLQPKRGANNSTMHVIRFQLHNHVIKLLHNQKFRSSNS